MPTSPQDLAAFRAELTRNRGLVDSIKMLIAGFTAQAATAAGPDQSDELKALLAEWKARDDELAAATVAGTQTAGAGVGPGPVPIEPQVGDPLPHNELSGGNPVGQQTGTAEAPSGRPAPPGADDPALIGAGTAGGEAAATSMGGRPTNQQPAGGDRVSFTGAIAGAVLTISGDPPSAPLTPGMQIDGEGVTFGTSIATANPDGTYTVVPAGQTVAATALTAAPLAGA
jgi:hypothetical protein